MPRETITFRTDTEKREALDAIADSLDRDRTYVLNEAISAYLDVHHWQVDRIKRAVEEADAGKFASDKAVEAFFRKWAG
jgi:predicted transcriptional regulator